MIGGTRTWRALESFFPVLVTMLKFCDIYSFGLVAWSIAIDGKDPFSLMLSIHLHGEERIAEIDRLKANDEVLLFSKFENWIPLWALLSQLHTLTSQSDSTSHSHCQ